LEANETETKEVQHRKRLSVDQKCSVLDDLVALEKKNVPMAQTVVRMKHNQLYLSASDISKWTRDRKALFLARSCGLGHHRALVLGSRVWFGGQEDLLYLAFFTRRAVEGLPASDQWLKDTMDKILVTEQPEHWQKFCASNGWVAGFKRRYRISLLCQTNKKQTSIWEKLPKIKKFHYWLLKKLQARGPQRCPKYGRFPALCIFHMVCCVPVCCNLFH